MDKLLPRLLVCDDDPSVIEAYKIVLESMCKEGNAQDLFRLQKVEDELFGDSLLPDYPVEWNIDYVTSGEAAVASVRHAIAEGYEYSAAFLDVRMPPGMDGHEAAKQIRALDPSVNIVIITGYCDYTVEDFEKVAGPGPRLTVLMKPVWPDQLRAVVRGLPNREIDWEHSASVVELPAARLR
ncbi:MAG: response regulator [Hyphomicrobium sp.]